MFLIISALSALFSCSGRDQAGSSVTDDCINTKADGVFNDDSCTTQTPTPLALAVDTDISASVRQGDFDVYMVPSDTQVTLTTTSGDADLYLFASTEFSNDALLCAAAKPFKEDTCTASNEDGMVYAYVDGWETSNYTINTTEDCSVASINRWIYRNMNDYYLFADHVPELDPSTFTDSVALVNALRLEERDPYSSISDSASLDAFFEDGKSYGFGFDWQWDSNDNARVSFVFDDSESARAGIKRSDIIVAVEGERWEDLTRARFFELIGNRDNPRTTNWTIIDGESETTRDVSMTFGEYSVNTVLYRNVYTHPDFSGKIGYLVFNDFLRTSGDDLDKAIQTMKESGVTELILDLRYNPGGFVNIAQQLASQIAGPSRAGDTLARDEHNQKYTQVNNQIQFIETTPSLSLNRLVALTTDDTASASELVINSLRPYIDVITIGTRTDGKSFVSSSRRFCGKSLNAMEAQTVNVNGVSVEGGIEADCYAADDLTRDFGINDGSGETEGMLQAALDYYIDGSCDVGPALAKRSVLSGRHTTRPSRAAGMTRVPDYGVPDP